MNTPKNHQILYLFIINSPCKLMCVALFTVGTLQSKVLNLQPNRLCEMKDTALDRGVWKLFACHSASSESIMKAATAGGRGSASRQT